MNSLALPHTGFAARNGLLSTFARWPAEVYRRQPALAAFALVMALCMVPTLLAAAFDTRTVNDISVWIKPTKFFLSLAVYYATLAWYWGYVGQRWQTSRGAKVVVYGGIAVGVLEMTWLVAAAVVGVPSHFNNTSMFWSLSYSMAGMGATFMLVCMTLQARAIARADDRGAAAVACTPLFRDAVVWSTYLAVATTLTTAFWLAAGTGHWVGGTASDAGGSLLFGWSRTGGDLRIAHFFALHAHQAVPFVVWLLADRAGLIRSRAGVALLVLGYGAFVVFTFVQALMGVPFLPF